MENKIIPFIQNNTPSNIEERKLKVGVVDYLNTKPLIYGLERKPISDKIELVGAYPARLAQMLQDDEIDLGLIPVAAIPTLESYFVVGDYCIASEAEVASVCLFSEVPLSEIEIVYLDYQSSSSVALLKWLMKEYWDIHPEILYANDESYLNKIEGRTAGLVIGDRALLQRKRSTFIYDLVSEWRAITGLPFVFAAWVSKKKLSDDFVEMFNMANAIGLDHIDEIVAAIQHPYYDMKKYYSLHLDYRLDERKRKGMELFLSGLKMT